MQLWKFSLSGQSPTFPSTPSFIFLPKLPMAYSDSDGVRSVGRPDRKQTGSFVENLFLGFPVRLFNEGAKGVNGFASAALASAGLGKGPRPPFHLMDWKGVTSEPGFPPALASTVAWTSADARQPSAPSSMPRRSTCTESSLPPPRAGTGPRSPEERLGDAEAAIKPQKKASLSLQG